MSLGEDFEILLRAIEEANLRIVDYHRDGKAKWAKNGPARCRQAGARPVLDRPRTRRAALALPHELPAFRDLLGIEPEVARRHFGAERPLIRRGDAAEYVEENLGPLLAVRR